MNRTIFRSIGAILAGMATGAILSIATDFVLETLGIFPPPDQGFFICGCSSSPSSTAASTRREAVT